MSKKVLMIVSTPRKGGNSERLCEEFGKGAKEAGHNIQTIVLRDKKTSPCLACETCLNNGGKCVQNDDMADIIEKLVAADVIVLSTPVYYYSISAQLKIMIDRTLAGGGRLQSKEFYLITTAADGKDAMEVTMSDMEGFVKCVPGSSMKGKIYGSAFHVGEIQGNPAMKEAFEAGKKC